MATKIDLVLTLVRRQSAIEKLEALRRAGPHVPAAEFLLALRESRESAGLPVELLE